MRDETFSSTRLAFPTVEEQEKRLPDERLRLQKKRETYFDQVTSTSDALPLRWMFFLILIILIKRRTGATVVVVVFNQRLGKLKAVR